MNRDRILFYRRKSFSWQSCALWIATLSLLNTAAGCAWFMRKQDTSRSYPQATQPFAQVDGKSIVWSEVENLGQAKLDDLQTENGQKQFRLLWELTSRLVDDALFAKEAQKNEQSVEAWFQDAKASQNEPITQDVLRRFFKANRDRIGVSFEIAAPLIKTQLEAAQESGLRQNLAQALRQKSIIKMQVPVPDLPRYTLEQAGLNKEDIPMQGSDDAPIEIWMVGDFECPYCQRADAQILALQARYPDKIRIGHMDFPLPQHSHAQQAAQAGYCAWQQKSFWPYRKLLFANQNELKRSQLKRYAKILDLNGQAFERCLDSEAAIKHVQKHASWVRAAYVSGTPAMFINGMKWSGLLSLPMLETIVDAELMQNGS